MRRTKSARHYFTRHCFDESMRLECARMHACMHSVICARDTHIHTDTHRPAKPTSPPLGCFTMMNGYYSYAFAFAGAGTRFPAAIVWN